MVKVKVRASWFMTIKWMVEENYERIKWVRKTIKIDKKKIMRNQFRQSYEKEMLWKVKLQDPISSIERDCNEMNIEIESSFQRKYDKFSNSIVSSDCPDNIFMAILIASNKYNRYQLSVRSSIFTIYLSIYLSIYVSTYLSVYPSTYLAIDFFLIPLLFPILSSAWNGTKRYTIIPDNSDPRDRRMRGGN